MSDLLKQGVGVAQQDLVQLRALGERASERLGFKSDGMAGDRNEHPIARNRHTERHTDANHALLANNGDLDDIAISELLDGGDDAVAGE